jgi:hypothetical protein
MGKNAIRTCIFCAGSPLTKTHIWPAWLNTLIGGATHHQEESEHRDAPNPPPKPHEREVKQKQGAIFSIKPYLACGKCNNGWMNRFEDEMVKFSQPIFLGSTEIKLTHYQLRVMVGWLSLITILAEYTNKKLSWDNHPITKDERLYFKAYLAPPPNWTIVAASLEGTKWQQKYKQHCMGIYMNYIGSGLSPVFVPNADDNTQISSFGMGSLFVQVFSCPVDRYVSDFRVASKSRGLIQLWPLPGGFWPFTKGTAKFPTKTVLKDDEAEIIADAFYDRLRMMTKRIR